ncbi:ATP-binding cassette domain-containing protein [Candidatus Burkholderia verschuerenii]|uniref:ATP-binding cassette domain-containing protein n=1 Tax=Candidatus Burkholderia verschuerenii TaxID=242163 RepID=UPI001E3EA54A|nr:ATP-binding cassette domain-containing protein [Candidatus Burkholderia verschuerenii]
MLRAVEAGSFADQRMGDLSRGQQQRVLIAHALVRRPSLLLLDEPLANLDVRSVAGIVALLHRLCVEQGIAVLLSAHDMNPLLPVMDRIVYLANRPCCDWIDRRSGAQRSAGQGCTATPAAGPAMLSCWCQLKVRVPSARQA